MNDIWLLFVKSFELPLFMFAGWILLSHLVRELGWRGILKRGLNVLRFEVQSGPHDFALAVLVLVLGVIVRVGTATEGLFFQKPQWFIANLGHAIITALGVICLIRIMAPLASVKPYSIGAVVVSLVYAGLITASALFWR